MSFETRSFTTAELRVKAEGKKASGYAAVYGVLSHLIQGQWRERIRRGAFDSILASKPDVALLINHDPSQLLGRTASGTLRLAADRIGLRFECDMPDTQLGRDTHELIKRGDYNGCSFAFNLGERDQSWAEEEIEDEEDLGLRSSRRTKTIVRTITGFSKLHDVSVVTNPAYPRTEVNPRMELVAPECRSFVEKFLGHSFPQYIPPSLQAAIDEAVNNRDLSKYPLSGWEQRQISKRRKLIADALD